VTAEALSARERPREREYDMTQGVDVQGRVLIHIQGRLREW
jgi:hypothetical protein